MGESNVFSARYADQVGGCLAEMGLFGWATVAAVKMASVLKRKEKVDLYGVRNGAAASK